jgi:hypothetical protein
VARFAKTSTTKGTKVHEGKPENKELRGTLCSSWFGFF